ncbi:Zinc/iron permease [Lactarius akahatsu]|uniref:Zinc/iron permease n=1 Tax=Lactarius akahatsu TaxID=416441 RepID=A0AAD4L8F7_9AGAM|nr:Zinc/iron permease [Lactarius akahatsu]
MYTLSLLTVLCIPPGVILSTAFVHLLQDAFDRLQDPDVKRYTGIWHWAGLIVLSSLLSIFLVEYISTAYVDHLHSYSSVPSTPESRAYVLQLGIMPHSLVIGFTLALPSGSDFESLAPVISFHQLFEGLSLGIRIAALPAHPDPQQRSTLSWLLALLFALTTPAGILYGLIVAGMLTYAACVEMLAADFVLDATLWRSSKGRQVLALANVRMGAAGMVLLEYVFSPV